MTDAARSANFYRNLPARASFAEATDMSTHVDLPEDWWIIVADIAGSTKAIEAGSYKAVNTVGVACIAAVSNIDRSVDLPFVFGGDGATFAVPDEFQVPAAAALRAAQRLSREGFGLPLRVGMVRVRDLGADGFRTRVGKLQLSPHVTQPVFSGRGWEEAERRIKNPDNSSAEGLLRIEESNGEIEGSFEGFECRWQNVPNVNGHKMSLLVVAMNPDPEVNREIYGNVLKQIREIYGDEASYHPLRTHLLQLSLSPTLLSYEWRVRSLGAGAVRRGKYLLGMVFQNLAGRYLFKRNLDTKAVRWSRYRGDLVDNSDFRKFDGVLRMIIDGSEEQAMRLGNFLDAEFRAGRLAYGTHKSHEALVTCIVFSYNGNHLHFVDGSDGGYALAAKDLKQRVAEAKTFLKACSAVQATTSGA